MTKGKSVWLDQEILDILDKLKVIPEQTYNSVLKKVLKETKK